MIDWIDTLSAGLEDYFRTGGMIMLPLIGVCLLMWLFIVNRILFFNRLKAPGKIRAFGRSKGHTKRKEETMNFHSGWAHVCLHRRPDPNRYHGMTAMLTTEIVRHNHGCPTVKAELLDLIGRQIDRRMTEYHQVIGVLAAIAPLLGLLGTVTGMMTTFNVMALFGTGNARAMANGISEALITTQTGLLIAIPGLYLKGWLDRQARTLQQQMSAVLYFFRRQSAVHQRIRKLKKVR